MKCLQQLVSSKRIFVKMKHFLRSMFLLVTVGAASVAFAQSESGEMWQPAFNEDRLLSMPDLLPLLGHFGSQWDAILEGGERQEKRPTVVELNWSGGVDSARDSLQLWFFP